MYWWRLRPARSDRRGPFGIRAKGSAYADTSFQADGQTIWIVNPDLLAARVHQVERLSLPAANLESVRRIEAWLEASLNTHKSVGVETELSTAKYRRLVTAAQAPDRRGW
jgi:predicted ABC-type ATPase